MHQEIRTEDWYFYLGQREGSSVVMLHANVMGECLPTVCIYSGTIGSLYFE